METDETMKENLDETMKKVPMCFKCPVFLPVVS